MDIEKIVKIVKHHGAFSQTLKASEELTELQHEVVKALKGKADKNAMLDEIADVKIMLEQLMYIYDISATDVKNRVDYKLNRTIKNMEDL